MKLLYILFFVLIGMCGSQGTNDNSASNDDQSETGIFAEVMPTSEGKSFNIDVLVYLDIIEVVDGHKIHGFGKKPLDIKDATLDKKPMQSIDRPVNTKSYSVTIERLNADFKMRFEIDGKKYKADFQLTPDDLNKRKTVAVLLSDDKEDK